MDALAEVLNRELTRRQKRNPRYSLRALAKQLELPPSTLSRVLAGKRRLALGRIESLLLKLRMPDWQRSEVLLRLMRSHKRGPDHEATRLYLDEKSLDLLRSWENYALLSMYELEPELKEAARRLRIPLAKAKRVTRNLQILGLIEATETGWRVTGRSLTAPREASRARTQAHREYIAKALEALAPDLPLDRTDFSGITAAIDSSRIPEAISLIRDFRRSLAQFLGNGGQDDEVYRLNIQLFPLSTPRVSRQTGSTNTSDRSSQNPRRIALKHAK